MATFEVYHLSYIDGQEERSKGPKGRDQIRVNSKFYFDLILGKK